MPHIYYELYYHVIWSTKEREDVIDDDLNILLKKKVLLKINELGGVFLEFNSYIDHCHLLVSIPPHKINISDFIGQIKGFSACEINKIKGEKHLKWQQGYGILSLSKKGLPFIRKYIQNQKEHHEKNEVIKILEFMPDMDGPAQP
jgi:putative transposase